MHLFKIYDKGIFRNESPKKERKGLCVFCFIGFVLYLMAIGVEKQLAD